MSLIAVPTSQTPGRHKWELKVAAPALGVIVVALIVWLSHGWSSSSAPIVGQYYNVIPMDMDIRITKDGELAAINNIDIVCAVEGQTTITTIVDEGSYVKKG